MMIGATAAKGLPRLLYMPCGFVELHKMFGLEVLLHCRNGPRTNMISGVYLSP